MSDRRCSYAQRERVADHLIQVDQRSRRMPFAREGEQAADDARRALGLAEDGLEAAAQGRRGRLLREPFGRREDGRERVVQLVGHARHRLAERRQLLGLEQLLLQVARLVVELLALGDVADERADVQAGGPRLGVDGDFGPEGAAVGSPQPEQHVGGGAIVGQAVEQGLPCAGVDEAVGVEGPDVGVGRLLRVAEGELEVAVGRERGAARLVQGPEVNPGAACRRVWPEQRRATPAPEAPRSESGWTRRRTAPSPLSGWTAHCRSRGLDGSRRRITLPSAAGGVRGRRRGRVGPDGRVRPGGLDRGATRALKLRPESADWYAGHVAASGFPRHDSVRWRHVRANGG